MTRRNASTIGYMSGTLLPSKLMLLPGWVQRVRKVA